MARYFYSRPEETHLRRLIVTTATGVEPYLVLELLQGRPLIDVLRVAARRKRRLPIGFVIRTMIAVHHRETAHGEPLVGRTWVRDFRRGILTTREVRLVGQLGPILDAAAGRPLDTHELQVVDDDQP